MGNRAPNSPPSPFLAHDASSGPDPTHFLSADAAMPTEHCGYIRAGKKVGQDQALNLVKQVPCDTIKNLD